MALGLFSLVMKHGAPFIAVLLAATMGSILLPGFESSASGASSRTLRCSDSVGQQGGGGEKIIGGVIGLVLPDSADPASLLPLRSADGQRYFVYKAFLAVSEIVAPYATVTVVSPRSAKLYYGPSGVVGTLSSRSQGRGLIAASTSQVQLPVCGPDFTGYVGGIIIAKPTSVTFAVTSPHESTERVTVKIGNG
jgi:hypothetical protein